MGIGVFTFLSMCLLMIFNIFLTLIGVVITFKGIYFYLGAVEASNHLFAHVIGLDTYYKKVALTYILPGVIMIVVGAIGCHAARIKRDCLIAYCMYLMVSIGLKIKNPNLSLYAYVNRLLPSEDFGILTVIAYPEYGIQVALLLLSIYLIYCDYLIKKEEKDDQRNRTTVLVIE